MVYDTIRLLPPRLARVLLERDEAIAEGAFSLEGETASQLSRDGMRGALSPELIADVEGRIARAAGTVHERRPLNDFARELGRLLRIAADLADPSMMGSGHPDLRRVLPEYYRFVGLKPSQVPARS